MLPTFIALIAFLIPPYRLIATNMISSLIWRKSPFIFSRYGACDIEILSSNLETIVFCLPIVNRFFVTSS